MRYVDFTVQGNTEQLELLKGKPSELGVEAAKHILLTNEVTEIHVWLACELNNQEKQRLIQGVWSFLDNDKTVKTVA